MTVPLLLAVFVASLAVSVAYKLADIRAARRVRKEALCAMDLAFDRVFEATADRRKMLVLILMRLRWQLLFEDAPAKVRGRAVDLEMFVERMCGELELPANEAQPLRKGT